MIGLRFSRRKSDEVVADEEREFKERVFQRRCVEEKEEEEQYFLKERYEILRPLKRFRRIHLSTNFLHRFFV